MAIPTNSSRFTFHFRHALDGKGRLTIPARWRFEGLKELHCSRYRPRRGDAQQHPVLVLMTEAEVEAREAAILAMESPAVPRGRVDSMLGDFLGGLIACPFDSSQRIMLPAEWIESGRLGGEVELVGVGRFIQVWRPDDYAAYRTLRDAGDDPDGDYDLLAEAGI